ncbi:hypothetical protein CCH79_00009549, partial [Gambusia affinis]
VTEFQQLKQRVYEGNFGSVPVPVPGSEAFFSSGVELLSDVKMSFWRVFSVVILSTCWLLVLSAEVPPAAPSAPGAPTVKPTVTNSSRANSTMSGDGDTLMLRRALYVLIGFTTIAVLYFLIRAVRLKKPSQRKKYGLLSNYEDSVDMEEVESDGDDTLYEARSLRRSEVNTRLQPPGEQMESDEFCCARSDGSEPPPPDRIDPGRTGRGRERTKNSQLLGEAEQDNQYFINMNCRHVVDVGGHVA